MIEYEDLKPWRLQTQSNWRSNSEQVEIDSDWMKKWESPVKVGKRKEIPEEADQRQQGPGSESKNEFVSPKSRERERE